MYTILMISRPSRGFRTLLVTLAVTLLGVNTPAAPLYRPERPRRSITTDYYELVIQKNSQIDLLTPNGQPLLDNAFPAIILENGEEVPLAIDHRSTNRYSVDNPLGKGNGFHYVSEDCAWRIATYPAERALTIDLTYTNNSKKAVTLAGIVPLSLGKEGKGAIHLGSGSDDVILLRAPDGVSPYVQTGRGGGISAGHIAAWSPATGTALVSGFLTHRRALGRVELARTPSISGESFDVFSSVCIFSSPIIVGPGEQVEAETLYFCLGPQDPAQALEAFAQAAQAFEPFPVRANLNGWLPPSEAETTAAKLLENISATVPRLVASGWVNTNLGVAWTEAPDRIEVAPDRFPAGLSPVLSAAKGSGHRVVAGLKKTYTDTTELESDLSRLKTIGIDTIELLPTDLVASGGIPSPHPLAVLQMIETSTMELPKVVYGRAIIPGPSTLRDWALDSRSYYLPNPGNPLLAPWARDLVQELGHFNDEQFIAICTLTALRGGALRPATPWTQLSPLRRQVLSRLLPAPANHAHPLDLFQEGPPRQWYLPVHTKAGDWSIAGLFNWEAAAEVHEIPLTELGLNNDNLYTVYDFWAGQYLGLIEKTLRVEVPSESVRLLGLRRYERRPMLVASSRHYTQGASDHTALGWVHDTRTLSGTYTAVPDEACTLTILAPEPYGAGTATSTAEIVDQKRNGTLIELTLRAPAGGEVQWTVTF